MTILIADARLPRPWSEVSVEDGAGRGTLEDWLAADCWPDATREAPKLVQVVDVDDLRAPPRMWYADGGRAVPLAGLTCSPHLHGLPVRSDRDAPLADLWPASRSGLRMVTDATPHLPARRRSALVAALLRWSYALPGVPPPSAAVEACLAACEAWSVGGAAGPVAWTLLCGLGAPESHLAMLCNITRKPDTPDASFYPWLSLWRRLRAVADHLRAAGDHDAAQFNLLDAALADAVRAALPWHDLLAAAVEGAAGAP